MVPFDYTLSLLRFVRLQFLSMSPPPQSSVVAALSDRSTLPGEKEGDFFFGRSGPRRVTALILSLMPQNCFRHGGGSTMASDLATVGPNAPSPVAAADRRISWPSERVVVQQLKELVLIRARFPQLFAGLRRPYCDGVLLFGPPSSGKRSLLRHFLTNELPDVEQRLIFFDVQDHDDATLRSEATSERVIRSLFDGAHERSRRLGGAPIVIVLHELQQLNLAHHGVGAVDGAAARLGRMLQTELLVQLSQLYRAALPESGVPSSEVLVVATSSEPWLLSPATMRRFRRALYLTPPRLSHTVVGAAPSGEGCDPPLPMAVHARVLQDAAVSRPPASSPATRASWLAAAVEHGHRAWPTIETAFREWHLAVLDEPLPPTL